MDEDDRSYVKLPSPTPTPARSATSIMATRSEILTGHFGKVLYCTILLTIQSITTHLGPLFSPLSEKDIEYELNVERPECNQGGVFPILSKGIKVDKAIVDKLTIYCPFLDLRDYKAKKFKAQLLRDMSGVVVTLPTIPTFLINNVTQLHALEGGEGCVATERSHKVVGVGIKGNDSAQYKQITYRFPKGMTCNNKRFNDNRVSGDLTLSNKLRVLKVAVGADSAGSAMTQLNSFVFWELVIDGDEEDDIAKATDEITKAMERMYRACTGPIQRPN
jgi:hypothetical protein